MSFTPQIDTSCSPSDDVFSSLKAINKAILALIDRNPRTAEDQAELVKLSAMQDKYLQAVLLLYDHKL